MKNRIKIIVVLGMMIGIGILAFWIVNNENLKIKGQFLVYETEQYLTFHDAKEVAVSLVIIDGTSNNKDYEKEADEIMLIDKNGLPHAVNEVKKYKIEKNKVYSVYTLSLQLSNLTKGETVFEKIQMNGKELGLGSIVVDIVEDKEQNIRDELELGWSPLGYENTYSFSVKSDSNDISILNALYDFNGDGEYTVVELNKALKKGKEEEISFELNTSKQNYYCMRPIIEVKKGKKHIIYYHCAKQAILKVCQRKKYYHI